VSTITTIPNKVYVECSESNRRIKAEIIERTDRTLRVSMPTGFVLDMAKRHRRGRYLLLCGTMEFYSDGKPIR